MRAILLQEITVMALYACCGALLRAKQILTPAGLTDISKIIINATLPAAAFKAMLMPYSPDRLKAIGLFCLLALLALTASILTSKPLAIFLAKGKNLRYQSLRHCLIFGNIVVFCFPLIENIIGPEGVALAAFFLIVQNLLLWTFGVRLHSGKGSFSIKKIFSPAIIAIFAGLACFFSGWQPPYYPMRVINGISSITTPLAMLMLGASFDAAALKSLIKDKASLAAAGAKLLFMPLLLLALWPIVPLAAEQKAILFILLAAPNQVSNAPFIRAFNGDYQTAAGCTALSTLFCLATLPMLAALLPV